MLLLTTAALPQLNQHHHPNLGRLIVPGHFSRLADTLAQGYPVAADNGCFRGLDAPQFAKMVRTIAPLPSVRARIGKAWAHLHLAGSEHQPKLPAGAASGDRDHRPVPARPWPQPASDNADGALPTVHPGLLWMAVPDAVGQADETLELFRQWHMFLCHLPLAFVIQNGAERPRRVPWDAPGLAAIFVGGTDSWRYGVDAAELIRQARRRGLHVHFGRISSQRLIRYAASVGATSFDSSRYSRWRDQLLPDGLAQASHGPQLRLTL